MKKSVICTFAAVLVMMLFAAQAFSEDNAGHGRIEFEKVVHNFGDIGVGSQQFCEFKFSNVGDGLLKIEEVTRTCGCTPFELEKLEYAPGQSGVLRVRYDAGHRDAADTKHLYVLSNDPDNRRVRLTIQANVTQKVTYEPRNLQLQLNEENAGAKSITLKSVDELPFKIRSMTSTGNCITAQLDTETSAKSFVIEPEVNMERLARVGNGVIRIRLDHPGAPYVTIPFQTLAAYELNPPSINILNAEPGQEVERQVWVLSNYDQEFGIKEVSSRLGAVELISKEQVDSRYCLDIRITAPEDTEGVLFTDEMHIELSDGEKLEVRVRGFYKRN